MATDDEIDKLSFRELDAAVDRVLFPGYFIVVNGVVATRYVSEGESKSTNHFNWSMPVPSYSTDNGEAVGLLLAIQESGNDICTDFNHADGDLMEVCAYRMCDGKWIVRATGQSFATAACRVFLKFKQREAAT